MNSIIIDTDVETVLVRRLFVSEAVMAAWLEATGSNEEHESILFMDIDDVRKMVVENEMWDAATWPEPGVAEWFAAFIADDEYWRGDRMEVTLKEEYRAARALDTLLASRGVA